jgi:small GTP-binding protein
MVDFMPSDRQHHVKIVLKILVVGEMGVGKSALILQYVRGFFSEFYRSQIGVDFANKELEWDDHTSIYLQLWDIQGQGRFGNMTHFYYQEAIAAFIVFDATRVYTFDNVALWKDDIDSKVRTPKGNPLPCLLLGTKIDLCPDGKWFKTPEDMEVYVKQHGFIGFVETSAKCGTGIEEAFNTLVQYLTEHEIEIPEPEIEPLEDEEIEEDRAERESKKCDCW